MPTSTNTFSRSFNLPGTYKLGVNGTKISTPSPPAALSTFGVGVAPGGLRGTFLEEEEVEEEEEEAGGRSASRESMPAEYLA